MVVPYAPIYSREKGVIESRDGVQLENPEGKMIQGGTGIWCP